MKQELFVVWHSKGYGWKPTQAMNKIDAELFAHKFELSGYQVKIAPKLTVTTADIVEG